MATYARLVHPEQIRNLLLRQPDYLVLEATPHPHIPVSIISIGDKGCINRV